MSKNIIKNMQQWLLLMVFSLVAVMNMASAQVKLEIVKASNEAYPIALVDHATNNQAFLEIINNDLHRSGRFLPKTGLSVPEQLTTVSQADSGIWRAAGINFIVIMTPKGNMLQVDVGDTFSRTVRASRQFQYLSDEKGQRVVAHKIADFIYEAIIGVPGSFSSKVAYVSRTNRHFSLVVADADGAYPQVILESNEPILSPTWSPDGRKLAYASFEKKRNQIIVQDLYSGNRHVVISEPGINSAPTWSPDGTRLAFTLSRDGNPEIYTANIDGSNLSRLTNSPGIDTEPAWGRDGMIYFTSDRAGTPQVYKMPENGGPAVRVSTGGNYNANATISADGKLLAMMQRYPGQGFGIALMDLTTGKVKRLTNGGKDEAPSFSGNSHMILYSDGRGGLKIISTDGNVEQRFYGIGSDVRKPSWSPNLR
ncbi:Tol-Pal system beta propeller repeat protein TolB [Ignatzschineria rhizosphaerae]|uniref:Tol-Pal system protein TolB n=1 Tax=Ignatzschineria rhizosphaerae TaxID=2923279 RepID=A0ABY3X4M6_9GAMM|nr:Tol-Pal system beta propeller repeat protein TolB [Ignatzschineria rhizosphaerae]UNM95992.1 Tol-Pal system beta propeller repeat protein TolB [Ignatzschineria rhizosphaerae]